MSIPTVSILTPSYHQAAYIRDCLHSVRHQTYPNIEHIVQDGGSTDETLNVLSRPEWEQVSVVSEPDSGQSDALIHAFDRSKGDIIGWINSDDALADRRTVEWIVKEFVKDPDLDLVYGHVLDTDSDNEVVRVTHSPPPWVYRLHCDINPIKQPGAFFRRRTLERYGFVRNDLHYTMDHELFLRLLHCGAKVRRLRKPLALNRHQLQRKSLTRPPQYVKEYAHFVGSSRLREYHRQMLSALVHIPCRVAGLVDIARLYQLQPATTMSAPPITRLASYQLLHRTEQLVRSRGKM
jgi:glycosyltransferase involved in cell wall biosynthesis